MLTSFNSTNGAYPVGGLTLIGNTLYGTTDDGGNLSLEGGIGDGTVYSLPVSGGSPTVMAMFNGNNGAQPHGALTLIGNCLYGATYQGGNLSLNYGYGDGVVFSIPVSGGSLTVLASFDGSDGSQPCASLTLSDNTLYGTTEEGGANGDGTVFSIPVSGGSPTVLASFNWSNGESQRQFSAQNHVDHWLQRHFVRGELKGHRVERADLVVEVVVAGQEQRPARGRSHGDRHDGDVAGDRLLGFRPELRDFQLQAGQRVALGNAALPVDDHEFLRAGGEQVLGVQR